MEKLSELLRAPIGLFLVVFAVLLASQRLLRWRLPSRPWMIAIAILAVASALCGPIQTIRGHMFASNYIAAGIAQLHGQPLYNTPDSPDQYAMLYGPATFWLYLPPLLLGHDLRLFELWVLVPLALTLLCAGKIAFSLGHPAARAFVLLQTAVFIALFSPFIAIMRADVWILCFAALQLAAALWLEGLAAALAMALCGAVLLDIKIALLPLTFLPALLYWTRTRRTSRWRFALLILLEVPLAASAFLVKGSSAAGYLFTIRAAGRHGFDSGVFALNILTLLFVLMPFTVLFLGLRRASRLEARSFLHNHRLELLATALAATCILLTGSKRGSGPWHLAPLVPVAAWWTARLLQRMESLDSPALLATLPQPATSGLRSRPFFACLFVALLLMGMRFFRANSRLYAQSGADPDAPHMRDITADLDNIVRSHPGRQIQMGIGSDATIERTWHRPELVAAGNHLGMEAESLGDLELSGLRLRPQTLAALTSCATDIWLIPRGDEPFSLPSYYHNADIGSPTIFPEAFRQAFMQSYRLTGHSRYFDLWTCARKR